MSLENQHIVLFDGVCNLCNGAVLFIINRDKEQKFKFASLQSETGQRISAQFNLPKEDFDSFVYLKQNKLLLRSDAVLHVLKDLGYPWKIFFAFSVLPISFSDALYDFIARNRFRFFGKRDVCVIPTAGTMERFLS